MAKLFYLASPYSHDDFQVKFDRWMAACKVAGILLSRGTLVFSPIAHSHPIAVQSDYGGDWACWEKLDTELINRCDEMLVLTIPGWKESEGIREEMKLAFELEMDILYVDMLGNVTKEPV